MPKENTEKDFWKNVIFSPTCWIRKGAIAGKGYNVMNWNKKLTYSHRASWIIHYGNIPEKMFVCHKCDIPNCVNPKHLFLGTQLDNLRDMIQKGRRGYTGHQGEKHRSHKLTNKKVLMIRKLWKSGKYTQQKLGDNYGVCQVVISNIVNRKIWKHI